MHEYIYLRSHSSYVEYDVYKLGKTINLSNRDSQYATGEIKRGKFIFVLQTIIENDVEKLLQQNFQHLNIYHDGGVEFYKTDILFMIEKFLKDRMIYFKKLSTEEIEQALINYIPRDYQNEIINNVEEYFKENTKGVLSLTCGTGKTLISLWIARRMNMKNIVIIVPSILLLNQWKIICDKLCIKCTITTYSSSYKLLDKEFDFKILDECHHAMNEKDIESEKEFKQSLLIKSKYQLGLTATVRECNNEILGDVILNKSLYWSIQHNIVCDYVIQVLISNGSEINYEKYKDKQMALSVLCALESIKQKKSHHLLIFANSIEQIKILNNYIKIINKIYNIKLYHNYYESNLSNDEQKIILTNFNKSEYGIISCVYCLGEGYDNPIIDGVVFSESMISDVRIVQSTLRAGRKNTKDPNKITKIILPIFVDEVNQKYNKIKEVIYQIGLSDELVLSKVEAFNMSSSTNKKNIVSITNNEEITENLKLISISRLSYNFTYSQARKILKNKKLKSKDDYINYCKIDNRLSINPEELFDKDFNSWTDYLSVNIDYYSIEECRNRIKELSKEIRKQTLLSSKCIILCNKDKKFPPPDMWKDYYKLELTDIFN